MSVRKSAPKTRHGATQPEDERKAKAVLLRLLPATSRKLDTLAKRWDCSRSEAVATLIVNEAGPDRSVDG